VALVVSLSRFGGHDDKRRCHSEWRTIREKKYAEQAGFPPEMAMQMPIRPSQLGEYRRVVFTAFVLNIAFTILTVGLSAVLLIVG
jgi:hypothetical protein